MKPLRSRTLSATAIALAATAALGFTGVASADHGSTRPGYEWRESERIRGEQAGYQAAHNCGYHDGLYGHAYAGVCSVDLSRYSYAYQRGFRSGFERGYASGYREGQLARCGGHGHGHGHGRGYSVIGNGSGPVLGNGSGIHFDTRDLHVDVRF